MADMQGRNSKGGRKLALLLMLALAALAGVNLWLWQTTGEQKEARAPAVPVTLAEVRPRSVAVVVNQSAEVLAVADVLVVPKIKGLNIVEIAAERGQAVKAGQLLARLDKAAALAKRQEALAAIAAAQAKLAVLDKDQGRLERLAHSGSTSAQRLDHIQAERRAAAAQLNLAQAQLASLDIVLGYHRIASPIDGLVAARYYDNGSLSDDKKPMFRISDLSQVKILTTVGEREFPLVKKGLPVEVTVDAHPGRVFKGLVSLVSPVLNPATRSGEVEVRIDNPDLALKAGMFARIRIELGQRQALLAPRGAVRRLTGTGSHFVYLAEGDRAVHRNITVGGAFGDMTEITAGLKPGDQVVVRGAGRLSDGAAITVARRVEAD